MSKIQVTFVFDKITEEISDVKVVAIKGNTGAKSKAPVANSNAKIELKGSSLILNDDVLDALGAKVDSKLVLVVEGGTAKLSNPKLDTKAKGGNKVTGKNTISCRGAVKDALELLGSTFAFTVRSKGVIDLIPATENQDVLQINTDADEVITAEDIESLYEENEEEEEIVDFNLN